MHLRASWGVIHKPARITCLTQLYFAVIIMPNPGVHTFIVRRFVWRRWVTKAPEPIAYAIWISEARRLGVKLPNPIWSRLVWTDGMVLNARMVSGKRSSGYPSFSAAKKPSPCSSPPYARSFSRIPARSLLEEGAPVLNQVWQTLNPALLPVGHEWGADSAAIDTSL